VQTTISFAKGLSEREDKSDNNKKIQVFDQLIWDDCMAPHYNRYVSNNYVVGESFFDEFIAR
jgi:hypothetical protein